MRSLRVLFVVALLGACGSAQPEPGTQNAERTTTPESAPPIVSSERVAAPEAPSLIDPATATIPCSGEKEANSFEFAEGQPGSATIQEAVDGWSFYGGAPYLRAELVSVVDPDSGRAALVDRDGNVRILLHVQETSNGWLVDFSERCLDP